MTIIRYEDGVVHDGVDEEVVHDGEVQGGTR